MTKIKLDEEYIESVYKTLGLKTQAGKEFLRMSLEDTFLFDCKQFDYGSKNISGFGIFGIIVRVNDKFERIKNLYTKKRKAKVNESIRDNLQDISNYAKIARLLDSGKWPNE